MQQYHAVCTSANVASCVPPCNMAHHGYELLATIDGTDTKFSCNLAHGLFSWMGAASEGGYLGADSASFFSAVVSGAAGSYIVTLTQDAGITTALVIQPGQDVHISGDPLLAEPPSWGGGGFTVGQSGSLTLISVALPFSTSLAVTNGGHMSLLMINVDVSLLARAALQVSGTGSALQLTRVSTAGSPALTGTITIGVSGALAADPPGSMDGYFPVCVSAGAGRHNGLACGDLCGDYDSVDWVDGDEQRAFCLTQGPVAESNESDFEGEGDGSYPLYSAQRGGICDVNTRGQRSSEARQFRGNGDSLYGDVILCKCAADSLVASLPYLDTISPCR